MTAQHQRRPDDHLRCRSGRHVWLDDTARERCCDPAWRRGTPTRRLDVGAQRMGLLATRRQRASRNRCDHALNRCDHALLGGSGTGRAR
jgi:hypothetical protein